MENKGIRALLKILGIFMLFIFIVACTNRTVVLPYNTPPLDLKTPVRSVRVDSFSSDTSRHSVYFKNTLVALLAKEGAIEIRSKGAESVLSGQLIVSQIIIKTYKRDYKTEEKINGKKVEVTKYNHYFRKTLSATVSYQLKKHNQVISGNTFQSQFDKTWVADSRPDAAAKALSDDLVINQSLNKLVMDILHGVSSHQTDMHFTLQIGSVFNRNEGLKTGIEYFQQGLYHQAISYWEQVINKEADPKLKAAAYFNLGVNQFREKHFADAFNLFRNADQLDPANQNYMAALSMTESSQLFEEQVRSLDSINGSKFSLTVAVQPSDSQIRIMNIKEKYQPGMALASGQYKIQVDHSGYYPDTRSVTLNREDKLIKVILKKTLVFFVKSPALK